MRCDEEEETAVVAFGVPALGRSADGEMTKDRLSPLDSSLLHLEDATSHMHMAAVLIFAGK